MRLLGVPRHDREARHRPDRRQRLAAKTKRADVEEIVAGKLRGRVPLDRQRQVAGGHAGAIIGDPDQPPPAPVGHDLDPLGAGIERVLEQLLDHAGRPLHHLAGGDAVDDAFGKLADRHGVLKKANGE
jgi:hypothetical protein